jgi:hypothetical protein
VTCCGETELLGVLASPQFAVEVHQCARCGDVEFTNARIDGMSFWVGAMGPHVYGMECALAEEVGVMPPAAPPTTYDVVGKQVLRA